MVPCCAPTHTNLFLGGWEREMLAEGSLLIHLYHLMRPHCYIDAIFLLWDGPRERLVKFVELLNVTHGILNSPTILTVYKYIFWTFMFKYDQTDPLKTTLFRKESAGNTILHASSLHPTSLVRSIP